MTEELEHIQRPSIPWRDAPMKTECGRDPDAVKGNLLTFDQFVAKFRKLGQQRTAMTTCMTCFTRCTYGSRVREQWEHSPTSALSREMGNPWGGREEQTLLDKELRAAAAVIAAHRDEFDAYLAGLEGTVSLAEQRKRHARG